MTTSFLIAAGLLTLVTAAPLLWAVLGRAQPDETQREAARARAALAAARAAGVLSQEEYDSKCAALPEVAMPQSTPVAIVPALIVAVLLPLAALLIYKQVGNPAALDPKNLAAATQDAQAPDLASALAGLEERLKSNPDDAQGWSLLARGYQSAQQFDKAVAAMQKVRELSPGDLDAEVGYAEALALAAPQRRIEGEALAILQNALERDPTHQRALWLSGIASMQIGDSVAAIKHWRTLEALLPEGSDIRASLAQQISAAEGSTSASDAAIDSAPRSDANGATATSGARGVTVTVSLAPELQDRVAPGDTLFVFARAASGPRMPLAIQRRSASELPLKITLDDSMSMMPEMQLSKFADIVIGARISKSGDAAPRSGDLQTLTEAMSQATMKDSVQITISEVVP